MKDAIKDILAWTLLISIEMFRLALVFIVLGLWMAIIGGVFEVF